MTTAKAENNRTEVEDANKEEPKATDLEKTNEEKTKDIQKLLK